MSYQITYCKFNLIINYQSPYNRQVWNYKKADTTLIKKALSQVNWYFLFDKKDVSYQAKILNDTITNVFSNFVPNKILTFDDRDPPWMNELIKSKIQWKNGIYKNYQNSSKSFADLEILQNAISEVSELIYEKKNDYYHQLARKLIDPTTSCKTYWSILKTFL